MPAEPPWALARPQAEPLCRATLWSRTNHQSFPYYPPRCLIPTDFTCAFACIAKYGQTGQATRVVFLPTTAHLRTCLLASKLSDRADKLLRDS